MKPKFFMGVAGNIGVGKTTFTKIIGEHFDLYQYYESVTDNPYLKDFYIDMKKWSFNLQIYFLSHRFQSQIDGINNDSIIIDRTIYEDREIFARNLYDLNIMTERDWNTYSNLFHNMTRFLDKPDLLVYLRASTDTLISRIKNRNRDFEKDLSIEYLHRLNILYDKWISSITDINIITIETDDFNIFNDKEKLDDIINDLSVFIKN